MLTKSLVVKEMDDAGVGLAQIATISAVDNDGDTYERGAFSWKAGGHQWAQMLPAHNRNAMPFGKTRVYEDGDNVFAELRLNMDTAAGRDWHAALKFDLATGQPVQEWSYGYDIVDMDYQVRGNTRVRVLKRLDVHEVSPVLRGAGIGTHTVAIKSAALRDTHFQGLIASLSAIASSVADDPGVMSATGIKQLSEIHNAIGSTIKAVQAGDEEIKTGDVESGALAAYLMTVSRRHLIT